MLPTSLLPLLVPLILAAPASGWSSTKLHLLPPSNVSLQRFASAVASAGDLNGDGFDDLAVGAPSLGAAGSVYVYFGGPAMDATPDLTLVGQGSGSDFGCAVGAAGDVNGDGHDDLVVGARLYNGEAGRAYVYFGGPGLDANADVTLNGDDTQSAKNEHFGEAVAGVGDINGDGHPDLAVGAPGWDTSNVSVNKGAVYVYFGGANSFNAVSDAKIIGGTKNESFGAAITRLGKFDNDNFADFAVGADFSMDAFNGKGKVVIVAGGAAPAKSATKGPFTGDQGARFGSEIASALLNGDPWPDLIVGQPGGGGEVHVFFGGSNMDAPNGLTFTLPSGGNFGAAVARAGKLDGDSYEDLWAGAPGATSQKLVKILGGGPMDDDTDGTFSGAPAKGYASTIVGALHLNADDKLDMAIAHFNVNAPAEAGVYVIISKYIAPSSSIGNSSVAKPATLPAAAPKGR